MSKKYAGGKGMRKNLTSINGWSLGNTALQYLELKFTLVTHSLTQSSCGHSFSQHVLISNYSLPGTGLGVRYTVVVTKIRWVIALTAASV